MHILYMIYIYTHTHILQTPLVTPGLPVKGTEAEPGGDQKIVEGYLVFRWFGGQILLKFPLNSLPVHKTSLNS